MRVRRLRLQRGVAHQFGIAARMPQRERQYAHQRTIAVAALVHGRGLRRVRSVAQRLDRVRGLDADVEHIAVDGEIAVVAPVDQPVREITQVHLSTVQQRREQAKRLRAVVRPGTRWHTRMRTREIRRRLQIDLLERRQIPCSAEFIRNTERVADQQADETAGDPIGRTADINGLHRNPPGHGT